MHGDTCALVMLFMFRLKPADRGRTKVTNDLTPRPATFDPAVSGERDEGEAGTGRRSRLGQTEVVEVVEVVEVAVAALGSCGLLGADTATAPQRITARPYKRAISSNDALAADGQPLLMCRCWILTPRRAAASAEQARKHQCRVRGRRPQHRSGV
ncbi:unnamed protein product [Gadus morhua 'NCC']